MLKVPLKKHSWYFVLQGKYLPSYVLFLFAFFEVIEENKALVYLFNTLKVAVYCEFGFIGVSGFDVHFIYHLQMLDMI